MHRIRHRLSTLVGSACILTAGCAAEVGPEGSDPSAGPSGKADTIAPQLQAYSLPPVEFEARIVDGTLEITGQAPGGVPEWVEISSTQVSVTADPHYPVTGGDIASATVELPAGEPVTQALELGSLVREQGDLEFTVGRVIGWSYGDSPAHTAELTEMLRSMETLREGTRVSTEEYDDGPFQLVPLRIRAHYGWASRTPFDIRVWLRSREDAAGIGGEYELGGDGITLYVPGYRDVIESDYELQVRNDDCSERAHIDIAGPAAYLVERAEADWSCPSIRLETESDRAFSE